MSEQPGLVVVGAVNVDLVVAAGRLPGPGETVVGDGPFRTGGGKGANAAVAASRSGAAVMFVGAVGADGEPVLADLERDGVSVEAVARLDGISTGVALIVVDEAGENQIAVGAGANGALTAAHVSEREWGTPKAWLISTEIPDEAVEAAVESALAAGVPCVLNPAPPTVAVDRVAARGVILTPNRLEAQELGARLLGISEELDPVELAGLLSGYTAAPVVLTLGSEGVVLVAPGLGVERIPAFEAPVVRDTTGAGDTFNGVFAAGLAAGMSLSEAAHRGVVAAALSVGHVGARTGMPSAEQIAAAQTA